ncbi:hypothetical protein HETIRDRAFT_164882 [Heterobasidion irregulare TC 32-1]|uniref:Uncharacterized protein n=1 Tax=Heterobasidion irregulare (strain TC 32-1) TaxID=747525 RepID=W4JN60_HETIT|nr:uncharacterized protein HETIRDRAFT_164882 [Heterobasidion irregulare TC 32-1]ETW74909.1 hypothetical protein HETIRDRAFT_164882 [Heterobasidion irregulare TC 32-1]
MRLFLIRRNHQDTTPSNIPHVPLSWVYFLSRQDLELVDFHYFMNGALVPSLYTRPIHSSLYTLGVWNYNIEHTGTYPVVGIDQLSIIGG